MFRPVEQDSSTKMVPFSTIGSTYNGQYLKIMRCPYCKTHTDSGYTDKHFFRLSDKSTFFVVAQQCTCCNKLFAGLYMIENGIPGTLGSYPTAMEVNDVDPILAQCSPHFAELYKQANACYTRGFYDLAGMGFRAALECLVKDFAIKCKGISPDEAAKAGLSEAIKNYLGKDALINAADVVRYLGNDYTHYQRKYEDYDIDTLLDYMNVLCSLLIVQIKALNPPLRRPSKNPPAVSHPETSTE